MSNAAIDDFQEEPTGADSPSIGGSYDDRPTFAHPRYAATRRPGVIWYDKRDGREDFSLGVDVDVEDLDDRDDRELLRVKVRPFRPSTPGEKAEKYSVEEILAYIEVLKRYTSGEDADVTERIGQCTRSQTFESLEAAWEWCRENVDGYAAAPRRDAVETDYRIRRPVQDVETVERSVFEALEQYDRFRIGNHDEVLKVRSTGDFCDDTIVVAYDESGAKWPVRETDGELVIGRLDRREKPIKPVRGE